ncbi:MAG: glycoside hydrolase family 15 protein [Isosphaeraceae bacterium]
MTCRIEDYGLIGDCLSAALVGRDGSIDWLCLPHFDSAACFAALLGKPEHGRWRIAPRCEVKATSRRYRDGTLVLETDIETAEGAVRLIDFMPLRSDAPDVVRIVEGRRGQVPMHMDLTVRFDYGSITPWVRRTEKGLSMIAGPDMIRLVTPVETQGKDMVTVADFTVSAGERIPFVMTWYPSYRSEPRDNHPEKALLETEAWWREWSGRCTHQGPWREAVVRSLITLKALTFAPTGGIVAAPTTSLPEQIGGVRNWDYRFCWLRDATFTLFSLLNAGYEDEAAAWRDWLLRAAAGSPDKLQIMYGLDGRRRLTEETLDWLPGYEGSTPVRAGNAAHDQFQLDVYGELFDVMNLVRRNGLEIKEEGWGRVAVALLEFLESNWAQPDEGIWEVRGPRRHFTHSKVMAWVAFDRAVKAVDQFGLAGPRDRWASLRDTIHQQVCRDGYNGETGSFVQYYGSKQLDASLLIMPHVGFLPATDPRVVSTVEAIERDLMTDGFVARYKNAETLDGLPPGEGAFLPCSFWMADVLELIGRGDDARRMFERLLGLCNDLGLISEEYDPHLKRLVGNFPQAFTHVSLINTAVNLGHARGPSTQRQNG